MRLSDLLVFEPATLPNTLVRNTIHTKAQLQILSIQHSTFHDVSQIQDNVQFGYGRGGTDHHHGDIAFDSAF